MPNDKGREETEVDSELLKGEGVNLLSWAFQLALLMGARNTWCVNDNDQGFAGETFAVRIPMK